MIYVFASALSFDGVVRDMRFSIFLAHSPNSNKSSLKLPYAHSELTGIIHMFQSRSASVSLDPMHDKQSRR